MVVSPGVPTEQPVFELRGGTTQIIGEPKARVALGEGADRGDHRHERKVDDDDAAGTDVHEAGRDVLVGGNIGVPLSAQVDASTSEAVHIVEVSSFQLETTVTFRPWIALWLNFADHLDRHPTVGAYAAAKARIFANQRPGDFAVVNADDPAVMAHSRGIAAERVMFSPSGNLSDGFLVDRLDSEAHPTAVEDSFPMSAVELTGRHMLHNVIAAAAVASVAGSRSSP